MLAHGNALRDRNTPILLRLGSTPEKGAFINNIKYLIMSQSIENLRIKIRRLLDQKNLKENRFEFNISCSPEGNVVFKIYVLHPGDDWELLLSAKDVTAPRVLKRLGFELEMYDPKYDTKE